MVVAFLIQLRREGYFNFLRPRKGREGAPFWARFFASNAYFLFFTPTMVKSATLLVVIASISQAVAFIGPPTSSHRSSLSFGFNGLGTSDEKEETSVEAENTEKKISAGGLFQLITAGMGAPFLGDYQGVSDVSIVWCLLNYCCCILLRIFIFTSINT